ncbi:TetR/AcrR family transcriptional regulator [Phytoactinopolyspora limicola]|uniref:TetR/AcrR family transcriptional regulator n=1 Tax=Phytoactinopolyspora limicola TaxID=2715536 RepID=UPI00140BCA63|nr:TetR/AcrR family transcriptional regulator [Phytoactinopolyspora limicola]
MSADLPADSYPLRTLELLWGRTAPSSRGPKPTLSVPKIVRTAIGIADEEGLDAVSMRRVAEELGFTTMSIYRHIPSKEDLLDLMQDAAAEFPADVDPESMPADWRAAVHWWARHNITMFRRHPWWLDLPISTPPMGPHHIRWMDLMLRALAPSGLAAEQKLGVLMLISMYTLSVGRLDQSMRRGAVRTGVNPEQWESVYTTMLAEVVDPREFPAVAELVKDRAFTYRGTSVQDPEQLGEVPADPAHDEAYQDLAYGLDVILDGIEALIAGSR